MESQDLEQTTEVSRKGRVMAKTRIEKVTLNLLLATLSGLFTLMAVAQPPELDNPSTGSGQSTTAQFFGGATADDGVSYLASYFPEDPLDVLGEIHVENSHVSSIGNLYVVGSDGVQFFHRLENGAFELWDGDVATLLPTAAAIPLAAVEDLTIIENLPFGDAGVTNGTVLIYLAYDTQQNAVASVRKVHEHDRLR